MSEKITLEFSEWQAQVLIEVLAEQFWSTGKQNESMRNVFNQLEDLGFEYSSNMIFDKIYLNENWERIVSDQLAERKETKQSVKFVDLNDKEQLVYIDSIPTIEEVINEHNRTAYVTGR